MHELVGWLLMPALTVWKTPLSYAECFGFISGLWCVWLTAQRSIYNFPVGILNCALLFFLFFEQRLFADAGLQIFFIILGINGWWLWFNGKQSNVPISRLAKSQIIVYGLVTFILVALLVMVLSLVKGSIPLFDALITALSLTAQRLLNLRKLESWMVWITVDLISIPVYCYKQLYLIALLYGIFLMLCIYGYKQWHKAVNDKNFPKMMQSNNEKAV